MYCQNVVWPLISDSIHQQRERWVTITTNNLGMHCTVINKSQIWITCTSHSQYRFLWKYILSFLGAGKSFGHQIKPCNHDHRHCCMQIIVSVWRSTVQCACFCRQFTECSYNLPLGDDIMHFYYDNADDELSHWFCVNHLIDLAFSCMQMQQSFFSFHFYID